MSVITFYGALGVKLPGVAHEMKVQCFANPDAHRSADRDPSCSVNREQGLYNCFACGASGNPYQAAIALGRTKAEATALLHEHDLAQGQRVGAHYPSQNGAQAHKQGLTLDEYAAAKGILVDWLLGRGVCTTWRKGVQIVRIPYTDPAGQEVAVRFRLALEKNADGPDGRFKWASGAKTCLYGLWALDAAQRAGWVVLGEGETDTQTLLYHGYPALGLPGASNWSDRRDAVHLDGTNEIFVIVEPDVGGEAVLGWVDKSAIRDRVQLVVMPSETTDPSALYLDDPERFKERMDALLAAAVPFGEHQAAQTKQRAGLAWEDCKQLAHEPRILDCLADDVRRTGLVGEERAVKLIYLIVVSRHLDRPVSAAVKGPSSAGKSYLVERVLSFFPGSAYYALTAMSDHALAYSEEPLVHRMLVLYEAAGMEGDNATYMMRSLLSEGCVKYETVDKSDGALKGRLIERPGPTGLITTTTKLSLHPENETRLLSIPVTDTADQTRAVMLALAAEGGEEPDLRRWHALSDWLDGAAHDVNIPFATQLAELIPPVAVRLRRDFGQVLALVRAHAILHQATRDRDDAGRMIATLDDYAQVRELVHDLVSEGVERSIASDVRETVRVVGELLADDRAHVLIADLVGPLGLDRSTIGRRVSHALRDGWLVDVQESKSRTAPKRLRLGTQVPADDDVLPRPEHLAERILGSLGRLGADSGGIEGAHTSGSGDREPLHATVDVQAALAPGAGDIQDDRASAPAHQRRVAEPSAAGAARKPDATTPLAIVGPTAAQLHVAVLRRAIIAEFDATEEVLAPDAVDSAEQASQPRGALLGLVTA